MSTLNQSTERMSFSKVLKAGFIAGFISAGLNNIWSFIAQALGSNTPPGFPIAVTLSSIIPTVIGAILFYVLVLYLRNGGTIFIIIAAVFTSSSLFPTLTTTEFQDGTPVGDGFTLLTLPMHLISGAVAVWAIPKFSK
jgi:hypothetical protein